MSSRPLAQPGGVHKLTAQRPEIALPVCTIPKYNDSWLVGRLNEHLQQVAGLNDRQFGFRAGQSTIDAIDCLRACSDRIVQHGGVTLAVSLDIANAFNTLPWNKIGARLLAHGVPGYLSRVIRDYFMGRSVSYRDAEGVCRRRPIVRDVPQGSVLGPLLWNIAYDEVLGTILPPGCHVVCYADDTLVVAEGRGLVGRDRVGQYRGGRGSPRYKDVGPEGGPPENGGRLFHDGSRRAPPPG